MYVLSIKKGIICLFLVKKHQKSLQLEARYNVLRIGVDTSSTLPLKLLLLRPLWH